MYQWIFVVVFLAGPEDQYVVGPFSTKVECQQHNAVVLHDIRRYWNRSTDKFAFGVDACVSRSVAKHGRVRR